MCETASLYNWNACFFSPPPLKHVIRQTLNWHFFWAQPGCGAVQEKQKKKGAHPGVDAVNAKGTMVCLQQAGYLS